MMPEALPLPVDDLAEILVKSPSPGQPAPAIFKGRSVDCSHAVGEYVSGADWRIKANANVGYSHAGLISNVAGKVIANFWLDEVYAPEEGLAHRKRSEEHTSELQSLMRIAYAVCCLKKKKTKHRSI